MARNTFALKSTMELRCSCEPQTTRSGCQVHGVHADIRDGNWYYTNRLAIMAWLNGMWREIVGPQH